MDIQVGDKVTYKIREIVFTEIINNFSWGVKLKNDAMYEILKVERPKYEVVEEKKELLTEEEKSDLKDIIENVNKYSGVQVNRISFRETNTGRLVINCFNNDYCISEMVIHNKFRKLDKSEKYTLEELGLEEN